jgi:two-component system cell cycle sensor histidine kinase/response regulator CckA
MAGTEGGPGCAGCAVLVADDDSFVRAVVTAAIRATGCTVYAAADGADAVRLFRRHAAEIAALVLDVQMPELDGPAALAEIRRLAADLTALFITGAGDLYPWDDLLRDLAPAALLPKPFTPAELIAALGRGLLPGGRLGLTG